jgi:integrase
MSRKKESGLPPYTNRDKSRGVIFRPYLGMEDGKVRWGARVWLAPFDAPLSQVWAEYESLHSEQQHTVTWLMETYFNSRQFNSLRVKTQADYLSRSNTLQNMLMTNGKPFGQLRLKQVDRYLLREYLDISPHPVSANRQIAVLSSAWTWALERFKIPDNPCKQVRPNKERPRTKYISDFEYRRAKDIAPSWLQVAMDLSYICRARRAEVLALTFAEVVDDGLLIQRSKGSKSEVTQWTPALRSVIDRSRSLDGSSNYLVRTAAGGISVPQFDSAWRRLMSAISEQGNARFTFHDIKAKGLSDMAEPWAGHKSGSMLDVYVRTPRKITPDYSDDADI